MNRFEIRKTTPADDFDAISRIYALSWQTAYRGIVPQRYLDDLPETRWAGVLREGRWVSYLALENKKYIGTASVCPARDEAMSGYGEIVSIYLLPEYFGRGYGAPLLAHAMAGLKETGYDNVYLWVLEDNKRARAFYEKNGFSQTPDRLTLDIGGKNLTDIRYIRTL